MVMDGLKPFGSRSSTTTNTVLLSRNKCTDIEQMFVLIDKYSLKWICEYLANIELNIHCLYLKYVPQLHVHMTTHLC